MDDYFALMERYPDIPISRNVNEDNYRTWLANDLSYVPYMFIDWDARTCNYDSEEFITLIKKLKQYARIYGGSTLLTIFRIEWNYI